MKENQKIVLFRTLAILLLSAPFGIAIWFVARYFQIDAKSFGLHIFATIVMAVFTLFEMFVLAKNMKKKPIIQDLAFNDNKKVNLTALIFVGIGGLIGLAGTLVFGIMYFFQTLVQNQTAFMLLFNIFLYLFLNCGIFLMYIPLFKEKKFKIEDLLK